MKINAFADVSLRAMMVLAAAPGGSLLTTRSIADAVGTPPAWRTPGPAR